MSTAPPLLGGRAWAPRFAVAAFSVGLATAYRFMGVVGFACGSAAGISLAALTNRSVPAVAVLSASAAATFLVVVCVTRLLVGTEYVVYFHHEIAFLTANVLLLWLLDVPVLPHLDIAMIGFLVFLGFGRIGCLLVGCCFGRPASAGVVYGHAHVDIGFPRDLAGMTLAPIQALESVVAFGVAIVGVAIVFGGSPGIALAWCIASYGAARFFLLEPLRGDARPTALTLSHAQWIAAGRAAAVLIATRAHVIPASRVAVVLALATVVAVPVRIAGRRAR